MSLVPYDDLYHLPEGSRVKMSGRDPLLYPIVPWLVYTPAGDWLVYSRTVEQVTSLIHKLYGFVNGAVRVSKISEIHAYEMEYMGISVLTPDENE